VALAGYPPAHHILGDLGIEVEFTSAATATARLPATSHLAGADGGVRAGVLAILVDVLGGAIGVRAVPDGRVATADLSLQVARPMVGPVVEARGSVLRQGRTTLVIEVEVFDLSRTDGPAACATLTFAVLPARSTGATVGGSAGGAAAAAAAASGDEGAAPRSGSGSDAPFDLPERWAFDGAGLDRPIVDALSLEVVEPSSGAVSLPRVAYQLNSFGAVQGGVLGVVADVAAAAALEQAGDDGRDSTGGVVVDTLQIAYLAQGRVGPIISSVRVLAVVGPQAPGAAVVTLRDAGADGRVTTVVNVAGHAAPPVLAGHAAPPVLAGHAARGAGG
jgi:uncharacterized protein (TIGR00369 family)